MNKLNKNSILEFFKKRLWPYDYFYNFKNLSVKTGVTESFEDFPDSDWFEIFIPIKSGITSIAIDDVVNAINQYHNVDPWYQIVLLKGKLYLYFRNRD